MKPIAVVVFLVKKEPYTWSHLRRTSRTSDTSNNRFVDHAIEIEKLLKRLVDERRAGMIKQL